MFISTFYSFKGGVGRSMALANVAVHLADTGKNVLVVDFDLEAPGLSSMLPTTNPTPGILEYVDRYQTTHVAPDVSEYCYRYDGKPSKGNLWVMPASANTGTHADTLARIDWQALYAQHDGYLMVEDLKKQWEDTLGVDYVFIDSRTGHTDVEGICTRQLPDVLVLLFFPNEQNRLGITEVSRRVEMHNENLADDTDRILQLYVAANVPDIDDEHEVLARIMQRFKSSLQYEDLDGLIHHYPSLRLLEQPLFVRDRRNTRLAREYLQLVDNVRRANPADEVGVLSHLNQVLSERSRAGRVDERRRSILDRVYEFHANNPRILFKMAVWKDRMGNSGEATDVLDRVVQLHADSPIDDREARSELVEARLRRARLRLQRGLDADTATSDISFAMRSSETSFSQLVQAAKLAQQHDIRLLSQLVDAPAVRLLASYERNHLLDQLCTSPESIAVAVPLAEEFLVDQEGDEYEAIARNKLGCILIGVGMSGRAVDLFSEDLRSESNAESHVQFNYAMAVWSHTGEAPIGTLQALVNHANEPGVAMSINYDQCLALACGLVGDRDRGLRYIDAALERSCTFFQPELSCWSYLYRHGREMRLELEAVREFLRSPDHQPLFMQKKDLLDAIDHVYIGERQ